MTNWEKITINSNCVKAQTDKAILIKIPKEDLFFWHPTKCVRFSGKNNYLVTFSFTDDFIFKVFKTGNGRYNSFDKVGEESFSANVFVEKFFKNDDENNEEEN